MVKELPRSRPEPLPEEPAGRSEPGVSRRDISWPAMRVRPGRPRLELPRWVDRLVVVLLLAYLLGGIAAAPFSLEESVQDSLAARTGALWTERGGSVLSGATTTPSYDSVRLAYGSVTRWAAAVGWYAAGGRQAQRPIDLDEPGPPAISVPRDRYRVAARVIPAAVSALGVVLVLLIGRRLAGRSAGLVSAAALALHPGFLTSARQAVDAGVTLTLGLACVLVSVGIGARIAHGRDVRLGAWTAAAGLAGLTLAAGYTAVPYVAGAAAFVVTGILTRQWRRSSDLRAGLRDEIGGRPSGPSAVRSATRPAGSALGWAAAAALGAVVVWVLVSPSLWGWLPERVATRHDERAGLIAQRLLPDPGPHDLGARADEVARLTTDPFLTPEMPDPGLGTDDSAYSRSWWAGLPLGTAKSPLPPVPTRVVGVLAGGLLTLASAAGLFVMWLRGRRRAVSLALWLVATAGWMVLAPSRQPDQALPLVALACVLSGLAVPSLTAIALAARERVRSRREVAARLRPGRSAR